MATRPKQRPISQHFDLGKLRSDVDAWYNLKRQVAMLDGKLQEGKGWLKELVSQYGVTEAESGSVFLDLQEPVGERKIAVLKNQRRVAYSVNMDKAEEILKRKGLWEDATHEVVTVVLDQDAVRAAFFDKKLTKNDLDAIFPQTVQYAFITLDVDNKPVA